MRDARLHQTDEANHRDHQWNEADIEQHCSRDDESNTSRVGLTQDGQDAASKTS